MMSMTLAASTSVTTLQLRVKASSALARTLGSRTAAACFRRDRWWRARVVARSFTFDRRDLVAKLRRGLELQLLRQEQHLRAHFLEQLFRLIALPPRPQDRHCNVVALARLGQHVTNRFDDSLGRNPVLGIVHL